MGVTVNNFDVGAVFGPGGATGAKLFVGSVQTNSSGVWSIAFPAGMFTAAPFVFPQAVSADATTGNAAQASVAVGTTATSASGVVTLPASIQALGGSPVKAAGAGITVAVFALGM